MNRIKILFTIATTLLLAGCAKEPVAPDGDAITVEASLGAATKVSAGGDAFTAELPPLSVTVFRVPGVR